MLTENDEIRKRWQRVFAKLLNGEGGREDGSWGGDCSDQRVGDLIAKEEIREALKNWEGNGPRPDSSRSLEVYGGGRARVAHRAV